MRKTPHTDRGILLTGTCGLDETLQDHSTYLPFDSKHFVRFRLCLCAVTPFESYLDLLHVKKRRLPWPQFSQSRPHDTLAPWHPGTLAPWHPGTLAPWHPGTLAPWHPGTLAPWHPGTLAPRPSTPSAPTSTPATTRPGRSTCWGRAASPGSAPSRSRARELGEVGLMTQDLSRPETHY